MLKADAGLAARARILRNRVRLTESYLAASALAEAGRYGQGRARMLALVPFRDAGLRARLYGVEIAKGLVAQAHSEAAVHPARALALLDRAEDIAPSLSAIRWSARSARVGVPGAELFVPWSGLGAGPPRSRPAHPPD